MRVALGDSSRTRMASPQQRAGHLNQTHGEVMITTAGEPGADQEIISYALARWDRTARLCVIRLTEAMPAFAPLVWLLLRRLIGPGLTR